MNNQIRAMTSKLSKENWIGYFPIAKCWSQANRRLSEIAKSNLLFL